MLTKNHRLYQVFQLPHKDNKNTEILVEELLVLLKSQCPGLPFSLSPSTYTLLLLLFCKWLMCLLSFLLSYLFDMEFKNITVENLLSNVCRSLFLLWQFSEFWMCSKKSVGILGTSKECLVLIGKSKPKYFQQTLTQKYLEAISYFLCAAYLLHSNFWLGLAIFQTKIIL